METFAVTHQGLKKGENQDRFFLRKFNDRSILMAVADGMGGEAGGGLAAQMAVEAFKDFDPGRRNIKTLLFKSIQGGIPIYWRRSLKGSRVRRDGDDPEKDILNEKWMVLGLIDQGGNKI